VLTLTVCAYAVEQVVQWRYGAVGVVALALVSYGNKVKSTTFTAIGLTALAVLLAL
jgi:hypothetical protein